MVNSLAVSRVKGVEYHLLAIALSLAAIIRDGGALSGDGMLVAGFSHRVKGDS